MQAAFFGIVVPISLCILNNLVNAVRKTPHSWFHLISTIVGPLGLIFTTASLLFIHHNELVYEKPFVLFLACGFQHVQSLTRLIIATTSKDRYAIVGPEFIGFFVHVAFIAAGQKEIGLWLSIVVTILTCAHFVVTVIGEITTYLDINCLTIKHPKVVDDKKAQ